jgi:hypothetical protein
MARLFPPAVPPAVPGKENEDVGDEKVPNSDHAAAATRAAGRQSSASTGLTSATAAGEEEGRHNPASRNSPASSTPRTSLGSATVEPDGDGKVGACSKQLAPASTPLNPGLDMLAGITALRRMSEDATKDAKLARRRTALGIAGCWDNGLDDDDVGAGASGGEDAPQQAGNGGPDAGALHGMQSQVARRGQRDQDANEDGETLQMASNGHSLGSAGNNLIPWPAITKSLSPAAAAANAGRLSLTRTASSLMREWELLGLTPPADRADRDWLDRLVDGVVGSAGSAGAGGDAGGGNNGESGGQNKEKDGLAQQGGAAASSSL